MDFTREPIIETVITPKEGCKIVVRSSKSVGQEEYFVDALEVVSFGHALFFRSLEKPKAFLVPASDYEILEVREARMVLKNVGLDRSIKIGGGRESKPAKESAPVEKTESQAAEEPSTPEEVAGVVAESRADKKRDRRRQQRRRRGREEAGTKEDTSSPKEGSQLPEEPTNGIAESKATGEEKPLENPSQTTAPTSFMTALLPPPPTLISETIGRYKENVLFKNAFYTKEEQEEKSKEEAQETKEAIEGASSESSETPFSEEIISLGDAQPIFSTFWDDMTQPIMPPLPHIEEEHEKEAPLPPTEEEKK